MSTVQWGDVPEWIAAVGTAGAFIFAAIVFWYDLRSRRREDRKAQARLVDAWVTEARVGYFDKGGTQRATYATFAIVNASAQAVRNVALTAEVSDMTAFMEYRDVVPPTGDQPVVVKTIDPLTALDDALVPVLEDYSDLPSLLTNTLTLTFVDAAGNSWSRDADGNLHHDWSPLWTPKGWKPDMQVGRPRQLWMRLKYRVRRFRNS